MKVKINGYEVEGRADEIRVILDLQRPMGCQVGSKRGPYKKRASAEAIRKKTYKR
jgi:hypothetical protein